MEKDISPYDTITLDSLIELLDSPEELKQKVDELKQTKSQLSDEVDGFVMYYDLYQGDCAKIKKQLGQHETKFNLPAIEKKMFPLNWVAIFILLIGSSITYYLLKTNQIQEITSPYEDIGLPNYMGENKTSKIDWKNVMFLYKTKQFKKLIKIENHQKNDTLSYFQGIASIKKNQLENGIKTLSNIPQSSYYFNKARYFQCVAYIGLKNTEQSNLILLKVKLEKNDPEFNKKVKELKN